MPTANQQRSTSQAAKASTPLQEYRSGLLRGMAASLITAAVLVYLGSMFGWLVVTLDSFPRIVDLWYWTYENLRSSVVPFLLVALGFIATLWQLHRRLTGPAPSYADLYRLDKRSDVLIGLFFGIGVIWTAIGMRSALVGALGGLDAESAARLGAFGVLQAMVDQGILLALSTTIVGGIGGYLMRLTKLLSLGPQLDQFYAGLNQDAADQVLTRLDAIETAVMALGSQRVLDAAANGVRELKTPPTTGRNK